MAAEEILQGGADGWSWIEDYMDEHDNEDEYWMSFHQYDVLDD